MSGTETHIGFSIIFDQILFPTLISIGLTLLFWLHIDVADNNERQKIFSALYKKELESKESENRLTAKLQEVLDKLSENKKSD